ncbi:MAG: nicotinamide riboside transporter PnuC [Chitinophagales bacterium]|nr:nicotinamide riboside transporter PnuC [Chitinophagales bacterium]
MEPYFEYIAVALGVVYVLLAAKGNIWCWIFGIVSSGIYVSINIEHKLYQDAILQFYYVAAGFYGWWKWSAKEQHRERNIVSNSFSENIKLLVLGAALSPVFGYVFSQFGNSLSYLDAIVTVFSFIATWMTARKILENWLFWIVIDVLAAVMYGIKELYATSALYLFFSVVALYGFMEWKKQYKAQAAV